MVEPEALVRDVAAELEQALRRYGVDRSSPEKVNAQGVAAPRRAGRSTRKR